MRFTLRRHRQLGRLASDGEDAHAQLEDFMISITRKVFSASKASWALAALLAAHAIMLRWVERRPWAEVGLDGEAARPMALVGGFLLGAFAIGIPTALLIGIGWLHRVPATPGAWLPAALRVSVFQSNST